MRHTILALLSAWVLFSPFVRTSLAGDLGVSLVAPATPVKAGAEATFTINITYNASTPATQIRVFTHLPFGIQVLSIAGATPDRTNNGGFLILRPPDMPAGISARSVTLKVRHGFAGYFNTSVSIDGNADDTTSGNEFSYRETQATAPDDLDSDYLPDWWESLNDLSTQTGLGDHGPNGDLDKDGLTNYREFVADTKANDPNSQLRIEIQRQPNGEVSFVFPSSAIRTYGYRVGTSLGQMSDLVSLPNGVGGQATLMHLPADQSENVFYVLEVALPQ